MGIYSSTGALRVTVVDGSTWTGLYASDGSFNVQVAPSNQFTGSTAPCGALYVTFTDTPVLSRYAPNGSLYVSTVAAPSQALFVDSGGSTPVEMPELPAGYIWANQVDPVTYDRDILVPWGDRWVGADPTIYDKATWRVTIPRETHSWSSVDGDEIIFEVRSGDQYSEPDWTDDPDKERAEMQSTFLIPNTWNWNMGWQSKLVGPQNTSPWCVLMQAFARSDGAGMGSPGLGLYLEDNDTMHLITRTGSSGSPTETYLASYPMPRDTFVDIWLEARWSTTGDGFARLYINNSTVIEAENINLGYTGQTHWEPTIGIYRFEAPETLKHHVKGAQVSW